MRLTYILEELIFILCARHTHTHTHTPLWKCGVLEPVSPSHVIVIAVFFCDCLLNKLQERDYLLA